MADEAWTRWPQGGTWPADVALKDFDHLRGAVTVYPEPPLVGSPDNTVILVLGPGADALAEELLQMRRDALAYRRLLATCRGKGGTSVDDLLDELWHSYEVSTSGAPVVDVD